MEAMLWYVPASSRGGPTGRRLRALDERPRNANELATELDPDYTTVRSVTDATMATTDQESVSYCAAIRHDAPEPPRLRRCFPAATAISRHGRP
jgi:hypothetical protein